MAWTAKYEARALRQIAKLDLQVADKIVRTLEERIAAQPDLRGMGKRLVGDLQGLWRFRIADYRVICELHDQELTILALVVGHRKDIYD